MDNQFSVGCLCKLCLSCKTEIKNATFSRKTVCRSWTYLTLKGMTSSSPYQPQNTNLPDEKGEMTENNKVFNHSNKFTFTKNGMRTTNNHGVDRMQRGKLIV